MTHAGQRVLTPSQPFHTRLSSLAAFLVPALSLWLPSGYAWGAALLALGALASAPDWWRAPIEPRQARWLVLSFGLMALAWAYGSDWEGGVASALNKPLRYGVAVISLLYALRHPPDVRWLLAGVAVGAACGGLRALYDVQVLGLERPWFTPRQTANAIQLGNLSGLLGLMCWLQMLVLWHRWRWPLRLTLALCCALGLLGSLLSQTRGGWLALMLCGLVLMVLAAARLPARRIWPSSLLLAAVVLPLAWQMQPVLSERISWAYEEARRYQQDGSDTNTSVGHRLDHAQLAWRMGRDRPLTGWGEAGYHAEKARRVQAGQASAATLQYGHSHNEILDMFAKRGVFALAALGLLYAVPLVLFWPRKTDPPAPDEALLLRLMGVAVPVGFFGFGLTQVFFAHYNGVVMYLTLVLLICAALAGLRRRP